ncbi:hypothetical protein C2W62_31460 [Candidatus Entotheonella serta]|nr:hypothetical protein C2W62_31460 [Candidatus Entotheonella serta]
MSSFDSLIALYQIALVMCIDGHDVRRMLHDDKPTVTPWPPIAKNHFAICSRANRRSFGRRNINAVVSLSAALIEAPSDRAAYGPDQLNRCGRAPRDCGTLGCRTRRFFLYTLRGSLSRLVRTGATARHLALPTGSGNQEALSHPQNIAI